MPRNDTAIITHLRKARHPLGDLQHLPDGENWWDKVHEDMLVADDHPYVEEQPGTHKSPVAHDRNAVIFWLEHKTLPVLTGKATSGKPGKVAHGQPKRAGDPTSGKPESGQGPLADPKKRRALERYAMDAATAYYRARGWDVEHVHDTKKVLDLCLVHPVSGEVRRVEVKGSSHAARQVEVTKAEVAKSREETCELFVLDKVLYQDTGPGPDDYTRADAVVPEIGTEISIRPDSAVQATWRAAPLHWRHWPGAFSCAGQPSPTRASPRPRCSR